MVAATQEHLPYIEEATGVEEARAARTAMRKQIARLEGRFAVLTVHLAEAGRAAPGGNVPRGAPALLGLEELEGVRDELFSRIRQSERMLAAQGRAQSRARARLEAMLADPPSHRFESVELVELGQLGCGAYQVRPVAGLLGMLLGWWRVKLSSGCP